MNQAVPKRATAPADESRVQRKKRQARDRIIRAAERLMRQQPVDSVTIQDITSAADIGHGTFYLHFSSKYEVLLPIIQRVAADWDRIIQQNLDATEDPAELMCSAMRYMGRIIVADPLWIWMLQHAGMPIEEMKDAVGRFAARDFGKGLMSGRFVVPDLALTSTFMLGAFSSGLLAIAGEDDIEQSVDQIAELMLRILGLGPAEARQIAGRPLPALQVNNNPIDNWQLPDTNGAMA